MAKGTSLMWLRILDEEVILDNLGELNVITSPYKGETRESEEKMCNRSRDWSDAGHRPRNVGTSRCWKRPRNKFSPMPPEGMRHCQCLHFSPPRPILDAWHPELEDNKFLLFKATKFMISIIAAARNSYTINWASLLVLFNWCIWVKSSHDLNLTFWR